MRWANKQSVPASTSGYGRWTNPRPTFKVLAGNLNQQTGKRPHKVSVTIILLSCSFTCKFLNV